MSVTPRRQRFNQIAIAVATQFAGGLIAIATAGSLALATIEYTRQGRAERAAETIRMVDRWEHPETGALQAYQSLRDRFMTTISNLDPDQALAISKQEVGARSDAINVLASRVVRQPGAEREFESVVYFFNRLSLCVDAELCDAKTSAIFFEDTLNTFIANFKGQIKERQVIDPHFAMATTRLSSIFRETKGRDEFDRSGENEPVQ